MTRMIESLSLAGDERHDHCAAGHARVANHGGRICRLAATPRSALAITPHSLDQRGGRCGAQSVPQIELCRTAGHRDGGGEGVERGVGEKQQGD